MADPEHLLSHTRELTHRVRLAQRGAWFPLLVFAAVTLAAVPFNRYGPHPRTCSVGHGTFVCSVRPTLALWYWPAALVVAYLAIGWFYVSRARERGVGTRVRPYLTAGVVLSALATGWALWAGTHPVFLADTLGLRPGQPGVLVNRLAGPAGVIGLALLLLAWIERSWALLAVTVAYLVVVVATVGMTWVNHPSPWAFLPHLLLDAVVLLLGGIMLTVTDRAAGPLPA
jgi:hypothetical protein